MFTEGSVASLRAMGIQDQDLNSYIVIPKDLYETVMDITMVKE